MPERNLAAVARVPVQTERPKIAATLPEAQLLVQELLAVVEGIILHLARTGAPLTQS
jgi:hypothetical protein